MMKSKLKFHLIATTINLLVSVIAQWVGHYVGHIWDEMFSIRGSSSYHLILYLYLVLFSWLFTFAIYFYKKASNHWLVFAFISLISVFIYVIYSLINLDDPNLMNVKVILKNMKLAYFDTLPYIIVSIVMIHFSQLIIGRKILPHLYNSELKN